MFDFDHRACSEVQALSHAEVPVSGPMCTPSVSSLCVLVTVLNDMNIHKHVSLCLCPRPLPQKKANEEVKTGSGAGGGDGVPYPQSEMGCESTDTREMEGNPRLRWTNKLGSRAAVGVRCGRGRGSSL